MNKITVDLKIVLLLIALSGIIGYFYGKRPTCNLGKGIERVRKESKTTQLELSKRILVPVKEISDIENGKIEPDTMFMTNFASELGLTVEELKEKICK